MRCAVSFLTVIVLSSAVGVMALLIIWFTESEDYCAGSPTASYRSAEFRCLKNGRCLKPTDQCNNVTDCPDGADEDPMYCNDLSTMDEEIGIMLLQFGKSHEKDVVRKPEICEFLRYNESTPAKGVKCHGRNMNESLDTIPWNELDKSIGTISIDNEALNTTMLVALEGNDTKDLHFDYLDKVYIDHNYIESVGDHAFCNAPFASWFSLVNNSLRNLSPEAFCAMDKLTTMKLSENKLHLRGFHFKNMPRLGIIDLDQNEIEEITNLTFSEVPSLHFLNLSHNRIEYIHPDAFRNNVNLTGLDLSFNRLHKLNPSVLAFQMNLKKFYITGNPKLYLPHQLFRNLQNLKSLNIDTLDISQIDLESFTYTPYLDLVFFKKFSYCRFVPKARRCYPISDGVSSNSNLLIGQSRVMVWLVGIVTILGNLSVLANRWALRKRSTSRTEITDILNIFVSNLAIADFLMGVYLVVLACKDVQFRGIYSVKAYEWGTSVLCSVIGVLALISSEVSLLILTIMSLERYITIGCTFSDRQNLNAKLARASMLIIWVFVGILAVAPAIQWPSTGSNAFYGSTGLCFPIHLDERHPVGWQYTTFVFIGVNSCCLVLITVSYTLLFYTVRRTQRKTPLQLRNIELASRFFLMVFTDVLCWAPIIMLKASVLGGYELSKEIIGWAVIYMLPLNSAVNPILYTFSTNEVRLAMKSHLERLLENLELNRMIPSSQDHGNSMELQCMTRSLFGGSRSGARRRDQEQPNTAGTEDTELTHSVCPTVSGRESRSWYSS